jgi:hypothetical protein
LPAISTEQALASYGYVYQIANNIPELKSFLTQAIQGGWTQDALVAKVESSPWWRQHADTVRNLAVLAATEPATYQNNLLQARRQVALKAAALGRTLTDGQLNSLAYQNLTTNPQWDDNVLSNLISASSSINTSGGSYHGQIANLRDHMTQLAQSYGVPYTDAFLNLQATAIEAGHDTLDGFENLMRARAKATYPQLADQIDAGMTVRDIADPYISTMAQTLELPETAIKITDPYVQKALQQRNKDGTAATQPLWQFTQTLKTDPRYDKTTQAKTDAMSTLAQIGKDFGFTGAQ